MTKGRFEDGGLYDLLPSVVRHRDSMIGEPLKTKLMEFGVLADRLESEIRESYANFFVETCGQQELAHIADLIGYRPIFGQPSEGTDSKSGQSGADLVYAYDPSKPALRRDVARTIWARRRKGTAEVLGAIVRLITGWHTVVFENNREVVSTPSIRFTSAPRSQGTPDFRKLVGRDQIDQGPGLVARAATVRRVDASGGRGRWHPLDVIVEAWPQRAALHKNARLHNSNKRRYLTLRNNGYGHQLYAPADVSADATRIIQSARAIHLSDFVGLKTDDYKTEIYGKDRAVCLYQPAPRGIASIVPGTPIAIPRNLVTFGSVPGPPTERRWIIDPENGRVQPPTRNSSPTFLRCYLACRSPINPKFEKVMAVRLAEHVPMEARAGIVCRPVCHPNKGETNAN